MTFESFYRNIHARLLVFTSSRDGIYRAAVEQDLGKYHYTGRCHGAGNQPGSAIARAITDMFPETEPLIPGLNGTSICDALPILYKAMHPDRQDAATEPIDLDVVRFLTRFQTLEDLGVPWRDARNYSGDVPATLGQVVFEEDRQVRSVQYFLKKVMQAVVKLASESPDFRYKRDPGLHACRYTYGHVGENRNGCGCIVGQALVAVAPQVYEPLKVLDQQYGASSSVVLFAVARLLSPEVNGCKTLDELRRPVNPSGYLLEATVRQHPFTKFIRCVQQRQDTGSTWNEAVRLASDEYPEAMENE